MGQRWQPPRTGPARTTAGAAATSQTTPANIDRAAANTTARPVSPPAWACTTANVIMAVVEDGPTATVRVEVSRAKATAAPTTVYRPAARAYGMRVAAAVSPAKASPRN